jgi:hypothetical protein
MCHPPPGRIGGSFESQASLAAPFDLRTFRPDRESFHVPQIRKPHHKNRVTSTQRKTLTTHVSSTCSPALRTFLLCWLVPRLNVVSAGSHRYTSSNASFQILYSNPPFPPIPISSGRFLRTLLHPFGLQGSVGSRKSHLQKTRRPTFLSANHSVIHVDQRHGLMQVNAQSQQPHR